MTDKTNTQGMLDTFLFECEQLLEQVQKIIMEQKDKDTGIIGVVADIFEVEKQYETAIETALGGNIQNIVTDTEATAKRLVQFLKQNKAGRATFLPLDAVKERGGNTEDVRREQGVIGYAADLVSTEERFHGVISYLLGR